MNTYSPSHTGSSVGQIARTYQGNPQVLQQRTQPANGLTPELIDLLALQKMQADRKAAANQMALSAGQQPTVAQGMEGEAMNSAREEVTKSMGLPGLMQSTQGGPQAAPQPPQQMAGLPPQRPTGLPGAQSNLTQQYQEGGIVAFAEGGGPAGSVPDITKMTPEEVREYAKKNLAARNAADAARVAAADAARVAAADAARVAGAPASASASGLSGAAKYLKGAARFGWRAAPLVGVGMLAEHLLGTTEAEKRILAASDPEYRATLEKAARDKQSQQALDQARAERGDYPGPGRREFDVNGDPFGTPGTGTTADRGPGPGQGSSGTVVPPPRPAPQSRPAPVARAQQQVQEQNHWAPPPAVDSMTTALRAGIMGDLSPNRPAAEAAARAQYNLEFGDAATARNREREGEARGLKDLQDAQVAARGDKFDQILTSAAASRHLPGGALANTGVLMERATAGYREQDVAFMKQLNALNEAARDAAEKNDIGRLGAIQKAIADLEAKYKAAQTAGAGMVSAAATNLTNQEQNIQTAKRDAATEVGRREQNISQEKIAGIQAASREGGADSKREVALTQRAITDAQNATKTEVKRIMLDMKERTTNYKNMSEQQIYDVVYARKIEAAKTQRAGGVPTTGGAVPANLQAIANKYPAK